MVKIQRIANLSDVGAFKELLPLDYAPNERSTVLLGAVEDGYATGALWAEFSDHDCEIKQLAVHPAFRRRGIGTQLLEEFFAGFELSEGACPVYMHLIDDESNKDFIRFLSATDLFYFLEQGDVTRISSLQRKKCKGYNKIKKSYMEDEFIVPFFMLPSSAIREFVDRNKDESIYFPDDILNGWDIYDVRLSMCHMSKNNVDAAIFVRSDEELLHVSYLHGNDDQKLIRKLLAATIHEMDKYCPDQDIVAEAAANSVKKILKYLTDGEAETVPVLMAVWNLKTQVDNDNMYVL